MVFEASLGFRNVSTAMELCCRECKIERAPSHEICIQWALKVGFHKMSLQRKKEDGQWIWIADHAVKAGSDKCLLVVGIRLDELAARSDLTLSLDDVTPLGVIPMQVSNGNTVSEEFEKLAERTGTPKALLIDHGSDLRSGTEKFCLNHAGVLSLYDITHKIALLLASYLEGNSTWQAFTAMAAQTKKELQLTAFHRLAPPNQRSKARWLNVDILTDWASHCLQGKDNGLYELPKQLQWLGDYRDAIGLWSHYTEVVRTARDVVRTKGYGQHTGEMLEDCLLKINTSDPLVEGLACELIDFVNQECSQIEASDRIIGTTEVIESGIGWFKNLLGDTYWSQLGLGRLTLALAGRLGGLSTAIVQQALQAVRISDVDNWLSRTFSGRFANWEQFVGM